MKELDPSIYKNKVELDNEIVYEIVTGKDGLGWGLAIADIVSSELHFHKKKHEIYQVLEGKLKVIRGKNARVMAPEYGAALIPPGTEHRAESLDGKPVRVAVFSFPAWTREDHLLVESS